MEVLIKNPWAEQIPMLQKKDQNTSQEENIPQYSSEKEMNKEQWINYDVSVTIFKENTKNFNWTLFIDYLDDIEEKFYNLENGWGDYVENKAFNPVFIKNIINFIYEFISKLNRKGLCYDFPSICPQDGNSIDIHWVNDDFQLLINIPEIENENFDTAIYGRSLKKKNELKWHGSFKIELGDLIEGWLKMIL